jgi:hypothetical protein
MKINLERKYTGIGSRNAPQSVLILMYDLASKLAHSGAILRSGGADGSDTAFENGCLKTNGKMEIYLPWKKFNNSSSNLIVQEEAFHIAKYIHPKWNTLKYSVKLLHARNVHQILGYNLDDPSDFVICWTLDGAEKISDLSAITGGTGTAIKLACLLDIPVYNLANKLCYDVILEKVLDSV